MKKLIVLSTFVCIMFACHTKKKENNIPDKNHPEGGREKRPDGPPSFDKLLSKMDANEDGKLETSEVKGPLKQDFSKIDTDGDGFISKYELENAPKPQERDKGEHRPSKGK